MKLFKYLTNWQYRHFYKKLKPMKRMIADEKFSRYKTLQLREEVRQEYDNEKAKLFNIEEQIKNKKETIARIGKDEFARLDDEKVRGEAKLKKIQGEMDNLTDMAYGGKPTVQNPSGVRGNDQTIEKLYDLIDFVKDYITKL